MNKVISFSIGIVGLAFIHSAALAAADNITVFRYVDEKGVTHFSDKRPNDVEVATKVLIEPLPRMGSVIPRFQRYSHSSGNAFTAYIANRRIQSREIDAGRSSFSRARSSNGRPDRGRTAGSWSVSGGGRMAAR